MIFDKFSMCTLFANRSGTASFGIMMNYWDADFTVLYGTVPSYIIITKQISSEKFTIDNLNENAGFPINIIGAYMEL